MPFVALAGDTEIVSSASGTCPAKNSSPCYRREAIEQDFDAPALNLGNNESPAIHSSDCESLEDPSASKPRRRHVRTAAAQRTCIRDIIAVSLTAQVRLQGYGQREELLRVATFNLQNLRLRERDGVLALDGAADRARNADPRPVNLAREDRRRTARVLAIADADVVALQEVFDTAALDFFHDEFLLPAGITPYPWRICLPGNDGRGLNVALMSRRAPERVESHATVTGADLGLGDLPPDLLDRPIFRRDCLEVEIGAVTFFVCHFKAPWPDPETARAVRGAEARAVRALIEHRFGDTDVGRWIILGDVNEPAEDSRAPALAPLGEGFSVDLTERLAPGAGWTYELPHSAAHSRPDRILVSPRLAREFPNARPRIIRSEMGTGDDSPDAEPPPSASDHALVYADFPGL